MSQENNSSDRGLTGSGQAGRGQAGSGQLASDISAKDEAVDQFLQQSKELLDDSADSLDAATLSRLNQARQSAVQQYQPASHGVSRLFVMNRLLPVTAAFAVAAIAAMLWLSIPQPAYQTDLASQSYEDIELLTTAELDLELLEDMAFISWLVQQDMDAGDNMSRDLDDAS